MLDSTITNPPATPATRSEDLENPRRDFVLTSPDFLAAKESRSENKMQRAKEFFDRLGLLEKSIVEYDSAAKDLYAATLTAGGYCLVRDVCWVRCDSDRSNGVWLLDVPGHDENRGHSLVQDVFRDSPRWQDAASEIESFLAPYREHFGVDNELTRCQILDALKDDFLWSDAIDYGTGVMNILVDNLAVMTGRHRDMVMMEVMRMIEAIEDRCELGDFVPVDAMLIQREVVCELWVQLAISLQRAICSDRPERAKEAALRLAAAHHQLAHAMEDRELQMTLLDIERDEFADLNDETESIAVQATAARNVMRSPSTNLDESA